MSWDIMLVRTKTNTEPMEKIDENNTIPFLFTDVVSTLKEHFPNITEESPDWLNYEGSTFSISFSLVTNDSIMLFVHIFDEPEDAVMPMIHELCTIFNCRAFDTTTAEFIKT